MRKLHLGFRGLGFRGLGVSEFRVWVSEFREGLGFEGCGGLRVEGAFCLSRSHKLLRQPSAPNPKPKS